MDSEMLEQLRDYSSATIANAIETFDVRPRDEGYTDGSIRCMFPSLGRIVGYAVTTKVRATRSPGGLRILDVLELVAAQPGPTIIVTEDVDTPPGSGTVYGDVNTALLGAVGCIGVVTNGAVRDLPEMEAAGFQVLASSVRPSHGYIQLVEFGTPVVVGGLAVSTGDLVHADVHGAVTIPREIAEDVPSAAAKVEESEQRIIAAARSGSGSLDSLKAELSKLS